MKNTHPLCYAWPLSLLRNRSVVTPVTTNQICTTFVATGVATLRGSHLCASEILITTNLSTLSFAGTGLDAEAADSTSYVGGFLDPIHGLDAFLKIELRETLTNSSSRTR